MAVVETGSLGRAAKQLNVTQPALSRIVKRLEARLNVELFERHAAGMDLTTFGEALLPYANFLQTESTHAIDEINALRGLERGLLRIGGVGSVAVAELPSIIERIHAQYPRLRIEIVQDLQDNLIHLLSNNKLDVVIAGDVADNDDIVRLGRRNFTDLHIVIASTNHPLAGENIVTPGDLEKSEWIMPDEDMLLRRQFDEIYENLCDTEPNVHIETRSPSTIKAIVAQTHLLGWLPYPMVLAEIEAKRLQKLNVKELEMTRTFSVYRRRRTFVSPQMHCFVNAIQE